MTTAKARRDALWDSFCHWTENWELACKRELSPDNIYSDRCALCQNFGCDTCPTRKYVRSGCGEAWGVVCSQLAEGKQPRKATEHMTLWLYLLFVAEGGKL